MPTVIVPFAGARGKTRLGASESVRREVSLAMLGDVLDACVAVGETRVVTPDAEGAELAREAGARPVPDPGDGQGAAVEAALAGLEPGPILIVNADLPCVVADDLRELLAAAPPDGIALAEASDGTTNALSLPYAGRVRAAVRRRQRGALRGARGGARPRGRLGHRAESRRRRRHVRRSAAAPGPLRAADARLPRATGSRREGRRPLRRRRRRALRPGSRRRRGRARRHRRRQRRRRRRGARAPRLARSRLGSLRARRAERRGARLGPGRRVVAGARHRALRSAARGGSRSATATSGLHLVRTQRCARASRSPP